MVGFKIRVNYICDLFTKFMCVIT